MNTKIQWSRSIFHYVCVLADNFSKGFDVDGVNAKINQLIAGKGDDSTSGVSEWLITDIR